MDERYRVMIASDAEHEKVFAEIYFDDKFVALVSQEGGLDQKILEFPGTGLDESVILREVGLDDFQQLLDLAVRKLDNEIR